LGATLATLATLRVVTLATLRVATLATLRVATEGGGCNLGFYQRRD